LIIYHEIIVIFFIETTGAEQSESAVSQLIKYFRLGHRRENNAYDGAMQHLRRKPVIFLSPAIKILKH